MKMYLLLRNNKQSGPHSGEELKSMGLKAYDLVWLEGKSAAWRYPSEIEELSAFAPIVEEQPFDRFYKKPSPTVEHNTNNDNSRSVSVRTTTEVPVVVETQLRSSPPSTGKRIIYVTMPAGKSPAARETAVRESQQAQRETANREPTPRESTVRDLPVREPILRETSPEAQPQTEPIIREMTPSYARAAIGDYAAQPSAEQTTLADHLPRHGSRKTAPVTTLKTKTGLKSKTIGRFVAIGLCILALLAAGIFIGLSLNKDTLGLQHKMVANVPVTSTVTPVSTSAAPSANPGQPVDHPSAQQLPVPAVTPSVVSTRGEKPTAGNSSTPAKTVRATQTGTKTKDHATRGGVQYTTAPSRKDAATATIPSMEREAVHRSDNAETNHASPAAIDKEALRAAVVNQVSVGANTYSVGTFGGISNLQVTVTNRSAYTLDLIQVEVQYILANKKVFRTENLYFRAVGAGSALMLEAPKSSRGIRVQYKVTTINSRILGLSGL